MKISILTVCPEQFDGFRNSHTIQRAAGLDVLQVQIVDIRSYADGCFRKVDDSPYGGGRGMILRIEPVLRAVNELRASSDLSAKNERFAETDFGAENENFAETELRAMAEPCAEMKGSPSGHRTCVAALTPYGETYTQKTAEALLSYDHLILICGHYEGMDARIYNHVDRLISIGDYVLSGGEIPAMAIADSLARLLPGVLKEGSLAEESFTDGLLEYPQYTRPAEYEGEKVPEILLSGNHEAIVAWRKEQAAELTRKYRPDLMERLG